jgi:hypothetical protein
MRCGVVCWTDRISCARVGLNKSLVVLSFMQTLRSDEATSTCATVIYPVLLR